MSKLYIFLLLIIVKIINSYLEEEEECSDQYDCFNCTLFTDCQWRYNMCINYTEEQIMELNMTLNMTLNMELDMELNMTSNMTNETKLYRLFDTKNKTVIFNNLKYLKNTCYNTTKYFIKEENYIYYKTSEIYCGKQNIVITNDMLLNGYKVQLNDVQGKFGIPNLICQYNFISGSLRNDVDIYINKSISDEFLLVYTSNYNAYRFINYPCTLMLDSPALQTVSFLYYSNKTFDTVPFIIYIKDYRYPEYSILDILFLLLIIFFVIAIFTTILIVRYKSSTFNKNKNYQKINSDNDLKKSDNIIEKPEHLSVISEKRNEENFLKNSSINDIGSKRIKTGNH